MTIQALIAELERRTASAERAAKQRRVRGSRDEILAAYYRGAAANVRNAAALEAEAEAEATPPGTGET